MKKSFQAFSDHEIGYYHVKKGSECEDYSFHYADANNKYLLAGVCDGHSPDLCFRSSRGAFFGCKVAQEELSAFFEAYCEAEQEEKEKFLQNPESQISNLKKAIVLKWRDYVHEDLRQNPIREEELMLLKARERQVYESGQHLEEIYGATFLASGICDDFYLLMHIGDGLILTVKDRGNYLVELPEDPRNQYGSPESLCDNDLLSRKEAFRCRVICGEEPEAIFLSSDGIEDSIGMLRLKQEFKRLRERFVQNLEKCNDQIPIEINEQQQKYLHDEVTFYTLEGNGAEDDCSLAGFYLVEETIPDPVLTDAEQQEWNDYLQAIHERKQIKQSIESEPDTVWNNYQYSFKQVDAEFGIDCVDGEQSVSMKINVMPDDEGDLPDVSKRISGS